MTVLNNIVNPTNTTAINNNFDIIEDELSNRVLKKTLGVGENNSMQTNIDMNNYRLLNLPTPVSPLDPLRLGDIDNINIIARDITFASTSATGIVVNETLDNRYIIIESLSPVTITLNDAPIGTTVFFLQDTLQQVTFVAGAGVTLVSPLGVTPYTRYSVVSATVIQSGKYVLGGDLG